MTIKTLLIKITLIPVIGLFVQTSSLAEVYKWVDENGQINYSDQPTNTSAKKLNDFKIRTKKSAATKNSDTEKTNENLADTTPEETKENAKEEPAKIEKEKISKKEKRRLCQEGRNDYKKISSRGRMREINKKGEYTYLSEKQRQNRLAAAKKKQRKYCR